MKSWEKIMPMDRDSVMYGLISEESSTSRGKTYSVEGFILSSDGSKGTDLMNGVWHDTLQGAKRLFDKDYDIDPNEKHKWKQIKSK